jgi:hypothetical protein
MQVFTLHEIITQKTHDIIFLDLKSAYDRVNRSVLWNQLRDIYGVSYSTIERLKMLFDNNSSLLLINGSKSCEIQNKRGLLQGSSLSPILFNFFLDPLLQQITRLSNPRNQAHILNSLAFADDLAIFTTDPILMQNILNLCYSWADQVDMQFAPTKCFHLGNKKQTSPFKIGNDYIQTVIEVEYLGIPFITEGINFESNLKTRTKNTFQLIGLLGSLGMNGTGLSTQAALRIYKAFIRPTLEYGLQLKILDPETINRLEKAQIVALRTIFSAPLNTSIGALYRLSCLESMALRNRILNLNFIININKLDDHTIPACSSWNKAKTIDPILWKDNSLIKRFHMDNNLLSYYGPIPRKKITNQEKIHFIYTELEARIENPAISSVANSVRVDSNLKLRTFFTASAQLDRNTRILINRWLLGLVAIHQPCKNCDENTQVNRNHAILCSGITTDLNRLHPDFHPSNDSVHNLLDQALQFAYHSTETELYENIAKCIKKIYIHCCGYRQKENGYWELEQTPDHIPRSARRNTNRTNNTPATRPARRTNEPKNKVNLNIISQASIAPDITRQITRNDPLPANSPTRPIWGQSLNRVQYSQALLRRQENQTRRAPAPIRTRTILDSTEIVNEFFEPIDFSNVAPLLDPDQVAREILEPIDFPQYEHYPRIMRNSWLVADQVPIDFPRYERYPRTMRNPWSVADQVPFDFPHYERYPRIMRNPWLVVDQVQIDFPQYEHYPRTMRNPWLVVDQVPFDSPQYERYPRTMRNPLLVDDQVIREIPDPIEFPQYEYYPRIIRNTLLDANQVVREMLEPVDFSHLVHNPRNSRNNRTNRRHWTFIPYNHFSYNGLWPYGSFEPP